MPFNPIPAIVGNSTTQPSIKATITHDHEIVTRMIAEAVAAEREACAKVAEQKSDSHGRGHYSMITNAIRARGEA